MNKTRVLMGAELSTVTIGDHQNTCIRLAIPDCLSALGTEVVSFSSYKIQPGQIILWSKKVEFNSDLERLSDELALILMRLEELNHEFSEVLDVKKMKDMGEKSLALQSSVNNLFSSITGEGTIARKRKKIKEGTPDE